MDYWQNLLILTN